MGLAMNGIHYLDTFQHFTGKLLNQVSAQFDNVKLQNPRGNKFNDKAGVIISNNRTIMIFEFLFSIDRINNSFLIF